MAIAFRSSSETTAATEEDTTVTAPAGIQDNDILILFADIEDDVTPTPPSGFTQIANVDHGDQTFDLWVWWKRASSETGDYVITHASTWAQAGMAVYSGVSTVSDPQNATHTEQTTAASTTANVTGLTPPDDGSMIVVCGTSWGSGTYGAWSGTDPSLTERIDDGANITLSDGLLATAEAVSNRTSTLQNSTEDIAVMISLRDPAADGGATTKRYGLPVLGVG